MLCLTLAAGLGPVFYPSEHYDSGLTGLQTIVLLGRNLMLVAVWLALLRECLVTFRRDKAVTAMLLEDSGGGTAPA